MVSPITLKSIITIWQKYIILRDEQEFDENTWLSGNLAKKYKFIIWKRNPSKRTVLPIVLSYYKWASKTRGPKINNKIKLYFQWAQKRTKSGYHHLMWKVAITKIIYTLSSLNNKLPHVEYAYNLFLVKNLERNWID